VSAPLALSLVEHAPDRRTAEIAAIEALRSGITSAQLRLAWHRWEMRHRDAARRGETG
jgi:hypothetical protein